MRVRQSHAATIVFLLVKIDDLLTPAPGEPPAVLLSRNGAAFTPATKAAAAIGDGWYRLSLTAQETDTTGPLILRAGREDTHEWRDIIEVVPPLEIDESVLVDQIVARLRAQQWQIVMPVVPYLNEDAAS